MNDTFDIVIPVGPNDKNVIAKQLQYTKKNIQGYRNIYLVCSSSTMPTIAIEGCTFVDEKLFPFTLKTVRQFHGQSDRNGWYFQQLLKLYAGKIIPTISARYLVIDADTFFLKPTTFIENDKCLYAYGQEYHMPYFEHMQRLDPGLLKVDATKSGICHHMMFEKKYINELFAKVEKKHSTAFYNVFLREVALNHRLLSGASEYEIYFNYMLKYHREKIKIRPLKWTNASTFTIYNDNSSTELDFVSIHWYLR